MNSKVFNISISLLMVVVFTTFNVGIPIVTYLCPMMSDEDSHCDMMQETTSSTVSFTSEIPDCCTSHIVAERNIVPYLSVEQFKVSHVLPLELVAHVACNTCFVDGQFSFVGESFISPSPPFRENISFSILNSTFLI